MSTAEAAGPFTTAPVRIEDALVVISGELKRARSAGVLLSIYAALRGPGAGILRRMIRRLLAKLEGGEMRSVTLRQIMLQYHGVEIGAHSYGCFDATRFPQGIRVGRYVSVGPGVEIYRRNHPLERLSMHPYFYNPSCGAASSADVGTAGLEVGADAWLGARAIILPGCERIGRGAVVAAGAVVTKDVPNYAVVAGNPARVLRYRFGPNEIAAAEGSRWWQHAPDAVMLECDMTNDWSGVCNGLSEKAES
ncbi:MAG: hypothetical protein ABJK20_00200 [Halieaceae bacterium]